MTQPREFAAIVQGFGTMMHGVSARWTKHDGQWMVVLKGGYPGVDYSGQEILVESSKGTKRVILAEKVADWGTGSYYLPERNG